MRLWHLEFYERVSNPGLADYESLDLLTETSDHFVIKIFSNQLNNWKLIF